MSLTFITIQHIYMQFHKIKDVESLESLKMYILNSITNVGYFLTLIIVKDN